jgi:hypothetical protein
LERFSNRKRPPRRGRPEANFIPQIRTHQ